MSEFLLLNSQKQTVFNAIERYGLNPKEFELNQIESRIVQNRLVHKLLLKGTSYYFQFDFDAYGSRWSFFSPGSDKVVECNETGRWDYMNRDFISWLGNLSNEHRRPLANISRFKTFP